MTPKTEAQKMQNYIGTKQVRGVPTVPGDMCASMQALGDQWLQGRLQSDRH